MLETIKLNRRVLRISKVVWPAALLIDTSLLIRHRKGLVFKLIRSTLYLQLFLLIAIVLSTKHVQSFSLGILIFISTLFLMRKFNLLSRKNFQLFILLSLLNLILIIALLRVSFFDWNPIN